MSFDENVAAGDRGHPELHNSVARFGNRFGFVMSPGAGVDASAEIQAQLNTHKRAWLGPGTFRLSFPLSLANNQSLSGSGRGLTILEPDEGVNAIEIDTSVSVIKYATVQDLSINGGLYGLRVSGANQVLAATLSRLECKNLTAALRFEAAAYSSSFRDIAMTLCDYGIYINVTGGNGWNNNLIDTCQFDNLNITGIHLAGDYAAQVLVRGCLFQVCDQHAFNLSGAHTWTIRDSWFESNGDELTGGPYADILLGGTESNQTWDILLTQNYISSAGANQGTPAKFLARANNNVNRVQLLGQSIVGREFDTGYYTTTADQQGRVDVANADLVLANPTRKLIKASPDGTLYGINVANGGALSTTEE